jgi:DNA-3-methyladenine glycosylase
MDCINGGKPDQTPAPQPLDRAALPTDTAALARILIGKILVRAFAEGIASARIVETEAYVSGDEASHTFRGITPRNQVMFGPPGYAYVYLAYGVSYMLNVSSAPEGVGEGVLIRAAEPFTGMELMRRRRGDVPARDLLRGPGRLAKALDIDLRLNGTDLCTRGLLWLAGDGYEVPDIGVSVRIGITRDAGRPLRFFLKGNPYVSGRAVLNRGEASSG